MRCQAVNFVTGKQCRRQGRALGVGVWEIVQRQDRALLCGVHRHCFPRYIVEPDGTVRLWPR